MEMFRARHEKAASVLKSAEDIVDLVVFYNPEGDPCTFVTLSPR